MSGMGKSYRKVFEKVDRTQRYQLEDSLKLVKETARAKFDETVDLAIRLGVDPRQADQNIRGTVALPHGMGKTVRVLAFAKGEKEREAQDAGADFVGSDELIKKISEGWLDFDKAVATPDMMAAVGRIGKILGPRGLMPNPKTGTVSLDIGKAVREIKAGKLEFRVDKAGIVHVPVGPCVVFRRTIDRQCPDGFTDRATGKTGIGQGELRQGRNGCHHHGAWHQNRFGADPGDGRLTAADHFAGLINTRSE